LADEALLSIMRPPRNTLLVSGVPEPSRLPPILSGSSKIVMLQPGLSPSRIMKTAVAREAIPPPTKSTFDDARPVV
jgi:hypothetical protein